MSTPHPLLDVGNSQDTSKILSVGCFQVFSIYIDVIYHGNFLFGVNRILTRILLIMDEERFWESIVLYWRNW